MARKSVTLTHPDGKRTVTVESPSAVNDLVYGQGYTLPKSTTVKKVLDELDPKPSTAADQISTTTK